MVYRLLFDLEKIKSPVVIVFKDSETRYTDGATAKRDAVFSVPVHVDSITARDNDIVIIVEESTEYNSTSWVEDAGEHSFF